MMEILDDGKSKIIVIPGDIHGDIVEELSMTLDDLLKMDCRLIAVDMQNVNYIYSRGIGLLVRAQKSLQEKDGALYLFNLKSGVQKILMETNLLGFLNGFSTREEMDFEIGSSSTVHEDSNLELGLKIEEIGDRSLKLLGTIDTESDMEALIQKCKELPGNGEVSLDVGELIYMDDVAVSSLVELNDTMNNEGSGLLLNNANEIILDQMEIMGVKGKFRFSS